jgi:hypothetical protein
LAEEKVQDQARHAEFLLEINLKILLSKAGARLSLKTGLLSLPIDPGVPFTMKDIILQLFANQ